MPNKTLNKLVDKALIIKGKYDVKRMMDNAKDAKSVNEKTLFEILNKNKNCDYGKKYDFASIHTVEEYQKRVPICDYHDLQDYMDRIYDNNEQNVLFSETVEGFSSTSGSVGKPKNIPLNNSQVKVYTTNTVTRMMYLADQYYLKHTGKHMNGGYGLCMFAAAEKDRISPHGLPATNIIDIPSKKIGYLFPLLLDLPLGRQLTWKEASQEYISFRFGLENEDILFIFTVFSSLVVGYFDYLKEFWPMLCDDIEKGSVSDSVYVSDEVRAEMAKVLKPNPARAAALRKEFEKGFDETIISRIWPNLRFINVIGTSPTYEPYTRELRKITKGIAIDFSIYGASEGLIAAAYETENPGQMMLLDAGFYEFIDQSDDADENNILTVDQLEEGKEYEIIITTRAGLYRYRFGDVIKVLGFIDTCPVINFSYRKGQLITVISEKTTLDQMVAALDIFQKKTNTTIDRWAVTVSKHGRGGAYMLLLESKDGTDFTRYEKEMDDALIEVNSMYYEYRDIGGLAPCVVKNLKAGTYDEWRNYKVSKGATWEQVKPVTALDTDEKREFFLARIVE